MTPTPLLDDPFAQCAQAARAHQLQPHLPALIDLSIGNPDLVPDTYWRARLAYYVGKVDLHGYGLAREDVRAALLANIAHYYERRFLRPHGQAFETTADNVTELQGTKEGILFALMAVLGKGDVLLLPDPSYPVYAHTAALLGAEVVRIPTDEAGQPRLSTLDPATLSRAKVLVLCSPANPTGQLMTRQTLTRAIALAQQHGLHILVDRAYAEVIPPAERHRIAHSAAWPLPGARDCVLELHSLSKAASLAGWRVGFAVGSAAWISRLRAARQATDFGLFLPIQRVVTQMLPQLEAIAASASDTYHARASYFAARATALGWPMRPPEGTFFLWASVPPCFGRDDVRAMHHLLQETGILVAPGRGFGAQGRGHVRLAMVADEATLETALHRLAHWSALSASRPATTAPSCLMLP